MRHTFHSEQWLPYPVDLIFAFFANPDNLPRLMPAWQKARIEKAVLVLAPHSSDDAGRRFQGIAAGAGTRMTVSFRAFPYSPARISWEAEITEFAWNDHFCDRQLQGPFAYWNHCHSVREDTRVDSVGDSILGTLLCDDIDYEAPLGPLGELANSIFLARQLRSTFAYRSRRTCDLLPRMLTHS